MQRNRIIGVVALTAGLVVGAFLGAWLERGRSNERTAAAVEVESVRSERLESEVSRLQAQVELNRLQLRLGRIALEADRQDYGSAGEHASRFFEDAAQMAERSDDERVRAELETVLAARDEVIAGLATAQPGATETLKTLYLDLVAGD